LRPSDVSANGHVIGPPGPRDRVREDRERDDEGAAVPHTILIAYDGSPAARMAVRVAGELFPAARAPVLTVHGSPLSFARAVQAGGGLAPDVLERSVAELAREFRRTATETAQEGARLVADAGLRAEPRIAEERPGAADAILAVADEEDADVIACGSRGRGAFARSLLGSTSSSVLHHATRPVLVVPDGAGALDGPALLAYDGSDPSRRAIAAAGRLLAGRPALVVHAWESAVRHTASGRLLGAVPLDELRAIVGDFDAMFADEARATVDEGVRLAREAGLEARGEAIESTAGIWRVLSSAATAHGAAVVVAGSRGLGGVGSVLLGSASSALVHNAERPTLIVPSRTGDGDSA
jgi:nucleotide-binding universal stress UspA family protein